jgi:hypothetical protein
MMGKTTAIQFGYRRNLKSKLDLYLVRVHTGFIAERQ